MAIGLACGSGNFIVAAIATGVALVCLVLLRRVEKAMAKRNPMLMLVLPSDRPVIRDIIYSLYTLERDWRQHFEVSGKDAYPTAIKGGEVDQMRKVASALDVRYRTDHHHSWGKSEADSTGRVSIHDVTLTEGLMPDVRGMGLKDALYLLESRGLRVGFVGHGRVVRQSIASGAAVRRGEYVTLTLSM